MILQPILDIAQICAQKGIRYAVISPGSRSAALTLAFARHPQITTKVIADERVAGFVALGLAQQLGEPVAVVCTSGSAAYNLAPAVVEAFFQEISLLILTADRPKEWIHQHDGQTMYQTNLYGRHVKKFFDLPADYTHPDSKAMIARVANEAINTAKNTPHGPVHINVPIREPFYPTLDEAWEYNQALKIVNRETTEPHLSDDIWTNIINKITYYNRILIAVGQLPPQTALTQLLAEISQKLKIPVVVDVISNMSGAEFIINHDVFLANTKIEHKQNLQAQLLITIGNSFISKNLKIFLRSYKPQEHWHIKITDDLIDPFQTLTEALDVNPVYFFKELLRRSSESATSKTTASNLQIQYQQYWRKSNDEFAVILHNFLDEEPRWNDFDAIRFVTENMPHNSVLHLANSMPVRYVNILGKLPKDTQVFANRGVSGIDGCSSTAVGAAMVTNKLVFLITGDIAFFYDRNALWHNHLSDNLRIILMNNAGGNIFRMIDGPASQPELETYFETRHHTTAKRTAEDAGVQYFEVKNDTDFHNHWNDFCNPIGGAKLIEIFTDPVVNGEVFRDYRKRING
jgi:2-succinyl-5-enolpyruvyl-6-hydroxy-3-cyclohexene-1-carboxylate synthase